MSAILLSEMFHLIHYSGPEELLKEMLANSKVYSQSGPRFLGSGGNYHTQAEIAFIGLERTSR